MARGCSESDSEEERHDRFRSERSNSSLNSSKSLFNSSLQLTKKSRSPIRRLSSPSRREHRSPSRRSRSNSKRRSRERKKSKERRDVKEKLKKDNETSNKRKSKDSRRSGSIDYGKNDSRERSRSKGRRSDSKEKRRKRQTKRNSEENSDRKSDTFLERFERRRPSVENEIVDSTVVYRCSSESDSEPPKSRSSNEIKPQKKDRKRKKNPTEAEEGELISEEENNCFGPALPPTVDVEETKEKSLIAEGPALPPGFNDRQTIGTALSERLSNKDINHQKELSMECEQTHEKDIPEEKNLVKKENNIIGPSLPPRVSLPPVSEDLEGNNNEETLYGPALPPQPATTVEREHLEEDQMIGPLPEGIMDNPVQRILEERAQSLRKQMENKDAEGGVDEKGRESWMLELPEIKNITSLGIVARKFRTREGPDLTDRSSWTETPTSKQEDRENTEDLNETRRLEIAARNEEMELKAKQKSSHRDKSLLEMHQKEIKKKKKKELENSGGKIERRPFSREIDLQSNRFDDAQKKSIIKKAQLLDSRFSSGETKYL